MVKVENLNGFDKILIDFLDAQKASTRKTYKCFLKKVLEYTGMTGQQILDSKKADKDYEWEKKAIGFKQWLKAQKNLQGINYSDNAANTAINSLRSFFDFYRTPLVFSQNENRKLNGKAHRVTRDYMLTNEDIAKMVFVGNLREKYICLVGKSFGLRAGDFASLTYGTFRSVNLDCEAPIFLGEFQTEKEGVLAHPFIDSDALPVVKAVLDANKDKPNSERIITVHDDELSSILQSLGVKANINLGGKHLRFHCFRKWLIDRLSSMMSESKWKQIVGKAISEDAYVSSFELKESYSKAMKMTTVLTNGNGKALKEMKSEFQSTIGNIVEQQQKDKQELIAQQQKDKEELTKQISVMNDFIVKAKPVFEAFDLITSTPEGMELWRKLQAKKLEEEYNKSRAEGS